MGGLRCPSNAWLPVAQDEAGFQTPWGFVASLFQRVQIPYDSGNRSPKQAYMWSLSPDSLILRYLDPLGMFVWSFGALALPGAVSRPPLMALLPSARGKQLLDIRIVLNAETTNGCFYKLRLWGCLWVCL